MKFHELHRRTPSHCTALDSCRENALMAPKIRKWFSVQYANKSFKKRVVFSGSKHFFGRNSFGQSETSQIVHVHGGTSATC